MLLCALSSRRRIRRRGVLDLFDLAFLAAALQGHFFFVDGHGVCVGFSAAAGALGGGVSYNSLGSV